MRGRADAHFLCLAFLNGLVAASAPLLCVVGERQSGRNGKRYILTADVPRTPQLPQRTGSHSRPAWKHLQASVWHGRPFFLTLQLQPGKRRVHSRSEQWQKVVQLTLLTWHSHWAIEHGPSWLHGRVLSR